MAQDITSPLQSISYTSKDFESVFVDTLDLVKQLTYRWDPSVSNESDPGVVLIKLLALLEDKCNYNIDKNTLECFPLSVTQNTNARQLFEQLGYFMHWHRGATTDVSIKWSGEQTEGTFTYTIPAFTMVSDAESSIVYSLIGPSNTSTDTSISVGSQTLSTDGTIISFKAIQGVAVDYDISGEKLIKASSLDENNRLYFATTDIAENGIFITNSDVSNYSSWVRKDNLLVEPLGNTYYKFGVTVDGNSCYLEFPSDAVEIFKDGIYITYIKTAGEDGNVAAQTLEIFYNDLIPTEDTSVVLSAENVKIQNPSASYGGANNETIDSAYLNYKKTVGTFNTLVTLRDYANAIYNSGLVSNDFVCDRTNDIQATYKIQTIKNAVEQTSTYIEKHNVVREDTGGVERTFEEPMLTAFSLKLFLLQYAENNGTASNFNKSFNLVKNANTANVKSYLNDDKLIQHDYVDIIPSTTQSAHFCMFKNKYPLSFLITPQYKLTETDKKEIKENIKKQLYTKLNSTNIDFGEKIDMEYIRSIILASDERIAKIDLSDISYTTYAVYWDGTDYNEVEISSEDDELVTSYTSDENLKVNVDADTFISEIGSNIDYSTKIFTYTGSAWTLNSQVVDLDDYGITTDKTDTFKVDCTKPDYFHYTLSLPSRYVGSVISVTLNGDALEESTQYTISGNVLTLKVVPANGDKLAVNYYQVFSANDTISVHISLKTQFRDEIYTKSVLAGVTQLFVHDEEFDYRLNQEMQTGVNDEEDLIKFVEKLRGYTTITVSGSGHDAGSTVLRTNESIKFFAPNLIDDTEYSNYVKFTFYKNSQTPIGISANSNYELKSGEYIIFYWKETTDDMYSYYCYGQGNIIKPSFNLESSNDDNWCTGLTFRNIGTGTKTVYVANSSYLNEMTAEQNDVVAFMTNAGCILSGSKKITVQKINEVTINSGDYYCYWITNDSYIDDEGVKHYVLFEDGMNTRTLDADEYFIYSNKTLTNLVIVGSGTKLVRKESTTGSAISSGVWSVIALDSSAIIDGGASYLTENNVWFKLSGNNIITLVENQFVVVNPNATLTLKPKDSATVSGAWSATFNSGGVSFSPSTLTSLSDFTISYIDEGSTEPVVISSMVLDEYGGWDAESVLNVYMSNYQDMVLLSNQHIGYIKYGKFNAQGEPIVYTIDGSDKSGNIYPLVLMSSLVINNNTSSMLPVYSVDDNDNITYPSLYVFRKHESNDGDTLTYTEEGGLNMKFGPKTPINEEFIATSGQTTITLMYTPNADTEKVTKSNVLLVKGTDYTLSNNVITLTSACSQGEYIQVTYKASVTKNSFEFKLPEGEYVIKLINTTEGVAGLTGQITPIQAIMDKFTDATSGQTVFTLSKTPISGSEAVYLTRTGSSETTQLVKGTDYTINYTTGVITLSISPAIAVGDVLDVKYSYYDWENIHTMSSTTETEFKNIQTYNLDIKLNYPAVYRCEFTMNITGLKTYSIIQLSNPYRYVLPTYTDDNGNTYSMSREDFEKYLQLLVRFDKNHVFNYTYEVPTDIAIAKPCDALSFTNASHIFNPFTICQYNNVNVDNESTIRWK